MPFPMAGQPQHSAAKTPMTWAAGDDHHVEFVIPHFLPQRAITTVVFGLGELLPHGITVIGRVAHAELPESRDVRLYRLFGAQI